MRSTAVRYLPILRVHVVTHTSIVSKIDTAAINSSLAALIGSDNPSFTNRIVSPR